MFPQSRGFPTALNYIRAIYVGLVCIRTQCPAFFTRETSALAQERASLGNLRAHPPCCLIDSVVGKLEAEPRALVTMITPHWPKAPWFPRFQHLAIYEEVLGRHEGLFTDSRGTPMSAPH